MAREGSGKGRKRKGKKRKDWAEPYFSAHTVVLLRRQRDYDVFARSLQMLRPPLANESVVYYTIGMYKVATT